MWQILGEVLSQFNIWLTLAFLLVAGWLMERIISKMALICRSVHVVHVPYGIMIVSVLVYLNGYITYKGLIVMALFYLVSYPAMWYLNYKFTRDLQDILKRKHVTHETAEQLIWPDEIRWIWRVKREWKKITGGGRLDDEVVDWILDYRGRNGYSQRHGIPIPSDPRNN